MADRFEQDALDYHRGPVAGKLEVVATKPLATQRDLSLAYSPGVAHACEAIVHAPDEADTLTTKANLVAVVSNGTAVLGLGAIGPLAGKPVMEGKAVLFKKFAGIDAFDIGIAETDPEKLIEVVAALEPSFGAINLEDIKAPDCFVVEEKLQARMKIPVFHDDQHGTAIIVAAAITNGLVLAEKELGHCRLVASGAGAAALACLDLLVTLGLPRENIVVTDIDGVVHTGRAVGMDPYKARYAQDTAMRTLAEAIAGADIFLGLSAPDVLKPEMLLTMAADPLVLALANPVGEIDPELARATRPDAIVATGRSDYPNQVNNVLCFPFIFRGALDVGATTINAAMKGACVDALARLARGTTPDTVAAVYGLESLSFGREYVIPKPFDPRLIVELPLAVAKAAGDSSVARRPITDYKAYRQRLSQRVIRSGFLMKPIFEKAISGAKRVVYTDGEEEPVLRAIRVVVDEGLARPILIGRPEVVDTRIERLGLGLERGVDFELTNPDNDPRFNDYVAHYLGRMGRRGVSPRAAREIVRTRRTVIAAIMIARGEADALIAGPVGAFTSHLRHIVEVLDLEPRMRAASTLQALVLDEGPLFIGDTHVGDHLDPEELARATLAAADVVRSFGIEPKVALLAASNFGSRDVPSAERMRRVLALINEAAPELAIDGEMHADTALSPVIRERILPDSKLIGAANLLIMPSLDAANIGYNLIKTLTGCVSVGPILIGPQRPAHIVTASITTRGIVNLSALAGAQATTEPA